MIVVGEVFVWRFLGEECPDRHGFVPQDYLSNLQSIYRETKNSCSKLNIKSLLVRADINITYFSQSRIVPTGTVRRYLDLLTVLHIMA